MTSKVVDPGYRLPSGDLTGDDLNCLILFYPDRDEYRRALWGALDYLGTWKAWERDTAKRGRDAATIWKSANECTWECFTMGCLDQLTDDVAAIKNLLQAMDPCCGQSTTINPEEPPTTTIEPNEGDPPDYYGETAITTWAEWETHVCYNAHRYVDQLVANAESMSAAAGTSTITLGLVAAGLALLSFTGIGLPIAFALAATVASGLIGVSSAVFATTADDIEDARDDIVCAIMLGASVADVIEDALGSASLDWTLLYQYVDYNSAIAIIYEGGFDGEYLPSETSEICDCEAVPDAPSGYEWVHPALNTYVWTTNIGSHTESYNPSTGELTIQVTSGGGDQLEYAASFQNVGSPSDDPFEHAYWFNLVSSNVPTTIDVIYNLEMRVTASQGRDGSSYAGYNTLRHSGAAWDNVVNPADYTVNYAAYDQDRLRMVEDPNKSAQSSSSYTFTVIVWALAEI